MKVLVTGAGGFIGTHLVRRLKQDGHWVRGVDLKEPRWSVSEADEFKLWDLRERNNCVYACRGMDWVFTLASLMGGMGFIDTYHADIIRDNTLINIHMIDAAKNENVKRYLFSSSACIYPMYRQDTMEAKPLTEEDAYPAMAQKSYGWEKLHTEHLCKYYREAGWLDTKVVRFHNCYGKLGEWQGGKEKAPAALSRKVAYAKLTGNPKVEIWGDGKAIRTYMYVNDCVEGLIRLMESEHTGPVNFGRDREISVDGLAYLIADIAETKIEIEHVPGPQGVRKRNSDNSLCRKLLNWEPKMPLEEGMIPTYNWIESLVDDEMKGLKRSI